ncbi:hypothetical protein ANASTE_01909 [Anaerofustis stercorihominis DSM 17244]|uniref:Uncharacterized protein n=1 Tax=Anaerofustis stercorihominis DSM 17244 TaxID=445971 RepID=B1C9Y3_9FIRM|nr:hypothetical protein [Anaerofustis stercorihominis]EDS72199.1 hypothetical protein ANASTE_01909 [Anaerofustis stercorihominis DSM 17244]
MFTAVLLFAAAAGCAFPVFAADVPTDAPSLFLSTVVVFTVVVVVVTTTSSPFVLFSSSGVMNSSSSGAGVLFSSFGSSGTTGSAAFFASNTALYVSSLLTLCPSSGSPSSQCENSYPSSATGVGTFTTFLNSLPLLMSSNAVCPSNFPFSPA